MNVKFNQVPEKNGGCASDGLITAQIFVVFFSNFLKRRKRIYRLSFIPYICI